MPYRAILGILPAFIGQTSLPSDVHLESLKDGFVRVKTATYSVEVPKAWAVGKQTPWGARSITSKDNKEVELGVMTAGVTTQTWDQLYKTSLFFILRQEKGTPTPYKMSKTLSGYDECSFHVSDSTGFAKRRFVLLKSPKGEVIALNVTIADPKQEKQIAHVFERMVRTAHIGS